MELYKGLRFAREVVSGFAGFSCAHNLIEHSIVPPGKCSAMSVCPYF